MMKGRLCLLALASAITVSFGQVDRDPIDRLINGTRTSSLGCGSRAIYLLLASDNISTSITEINALVDADGDGICTAADIINYFKSRSMDAKLVRCEFSDLLTSERKNILIFGSGNQEGVFHFSLVLFSKDGKLLLIDPTESADPVPLDRKHLDKVWGGLAVAVGNG